MVGIIYEYVKNLALYKNYVKFYLLPFLKKSYLVNWKF